MKQVTPGALDGVNSPLLILTKQALDHIHLPTANILHAVRKSLAGLKDSGNEEKHGTQCPPKLKIQLPQSVSYAMLGRNHETEVVGFKASFTHWDKHDQNSRRSKSYFTSLLLFDDHSGLPIALLDGAPVGAARTPAVSALLAQASGARPHSVLVIGSGTQGQNTAPYLLETFSSIKKLYLAGHYRSGLQIAARNAQQSAAQLNRHIDIQLTDAPHKVSKRCDLIIGAAGPDTQCVISADDVSTGTTVVVVGYGIGSSIGQNATRVITTSVEQMRITGTDFADSQGNLPQVNAELPELLHQNKVLEPSAGITFCYNSGLAITDIAVGNLMANYARNRGLGMEVSLW